jgi:glutathione S-transferase
MYILYHYPLCPLSRQIRFLLLEKQIEFESVIENYWQKSNSFPEVSPASGIPILITESGAISDASAIYEYIEESQIDQRSLFGSDSITRANSRRVANCFNSSFFHLVSKPIIMQRIVSFTNNGGAPNSSVIRQARQDVKYFLDCIAYLLKKNQFLAGRDLSIADIVAASHLSVLDYFGDVPWEFNSHAKEWYSIIKSRPSFKPFLKDRIGGFTPAKHYDVLDF